MKIHRPKCCHRNCSGNEIILKFSQWRTCTLEANVWMRHLAAPPPPTSANSPSTPIREWGTPPPPPRGRFQTWRTHGGRGCRRSGAIAFVGGGEGSPTGGPRGDRGRRGSRGFFFLVRLGSSPIPNPDPLPTSTKVAAMALGFRILRLI